MTFATSNGQQFPADLYYVSPTQINLIIPPGVPFTDTITITVKSSAGSASLTQAFFFGIVSPGIFTADGSGSGVPAGFAITVNPDGSSSTAPLFQCTANPLICTPVPISLEGPGTKVYLSLYATGVRGLSKLANASATVGGVPAQVVYAGSQGSFPALDQVNLLVDPYTGPRLVDVQFYVDGHTSNVVKVQFR